MFAVSRCCAGAQCRYRHTGYYRKFMPQLSEREDFVTVCPEQLGGLPTPREGCIVIASSNGHPYGRVLGRKTKTDYSTEYYAGARRALGILQALDIHTAYLLRSSPACGLDYGVFAKMCVKAGVVVIPV